MELMPSGRLCKGHNGRGQDRNWVEEKKRVQVSGEGPFLTTRKKGLREVAKGTVRCTESR